MLRYGAESWTCFIQRIVLLLVGACLTYAVSKRLLREQQDLSTATTSHQPSSAQLEILRRCGVSFKALDAHEKDLIHMIVSPESVHESFDDVVGLADQVALLRKMVVGPLQQPANDRPIKTINGVLLHGVPGTGKTLLARATAKALDRPFVHFDIASVEDKFVGESNRRLRAVFSLVRKLGGRCVVFFDEFDGIANRRNYQADQHHVNSLKTCLLQLMDGLRADGGDDRPIFMAATNNLAQVDPAFLRRLRVHVHVPLPDADALATLLRREAPGVDVSRAFLDRCVAQKLSGSDIVQLCVVAEHYREGDEPLTPQNLERALQQLTG